jgi:hypothetical protein
MPEVAIKKYVVRLSKDERSALESLISKGKHPAAMILKARILLKADVSDAGEGWTSASPLSRVYASGWSRKASTPSWRESILRTRPASACLTARRKQN